MVEGGLKVAHARVVLSIPPGYSVSKVVGYVEGRSAIGVARYVSTFGLNEEAIPEYVRSQDEDDERLDQMKLFE